MKSNFEYGRDYDRSGVLKLLEEKKYKRVIDIGASANGWSKDYLTHYSDIIQWDNPKLIGFLGNICSTLIWDAILEDVDKNGKFDFAICSHVLEDISSPLLVNEMLCKIAKGGYIAVPSKNTELSRNSESNFNIDAKKPWCRYLGYIHHRWVYNKEGDDFVAYPKLTFIEYVDWSPIVQKFNGVKDLHFFWEDEFKIEFINGDWMGPTTFAPYDHFQGLFKD